MTILPPKKYEDPSDSRFDSIRHKPWFSGLYRVRGRLPKLKMALLERSITMAPIRSVAQNHAIPEKELRQYERFLRRSRKLFLMEISTIEDIMLSKAYELYCAKNGDLSFTDCIRIVCSSSLLWKETRLSYRHLVNKWETNPMFIPDEYNPLPQTHEKSKNPHSIYCRFLGDRGTK